MSPVRIRVLAMLTTNELRNIARSSSKTCVPFSAVLRRKLVRRASAKSIGEHIRLDKESLDGDLQTPPRLCNVVAHEIEVVAGT